MAQILIQNVNSDTFLNKVYQDVNSKQSHRTSIPTVYCCMVSKSTCPTIIHHCNTDNINLRSG